MSDLSSGLRVVVLHNSDFAKLPPDDPAFTARFDVENAARGVAEALASRGWRAEVMGVDYDTIGEVLTALDEDPPDLVFNLCESMRGDARHEVVIPAVLGLAEVPYTGSGPVAVGLCLRKDRTKALLRARGVPTPEGVVLPSPEAARECRLPFPLIVKPVHEDASVGISSSSVVRDGASLAAAVARVLADQKQPALAERYIEGREMYVSLLGNNPPEALPMHEIDFSCMPDGLPHIVSYAGKWEPGSPDYVGTRPIRCVLSDAVRDRVVRAAREAFDALELADYGRVDVRLAADNTPYIIDVNPNCDITNGAGFSRAAGYGGLSYPDLVERIAHHALERQRAHVLRRASETAANAAVTSAVASGGRAAHPAAAALRSRTSRGADPDGRPVPARRGDVRPRADRRRARQPRG